MKKVVILIAISLLAGIVRVQAQSSGNTQSKAGSSAVHKANNSQLQGKGVPYNKEKEQFGKQISKKRSGPIPPSSVSSGAGASDAAQANKTPGSHVAQREMKMGRKTSAKTGTPSPKTGTHK